MKYIMCYVFLLNLFHFECLAEPKKNCAQRNNKLSISNKNKKISQDEKTKVELEEAVNESEYNTYEDISYYDEDDVPEHEDTTKWFEERTGSIFTKYKKQYVDHENPYRAGHWYMKCYQNTEFWHPFAPIYLYVGGNGPLDEDLLKGGLMYDLASETGGVMFAAEHRYYGEDEMNFDIAYLHSKQALADLHSLIEDIRGEPEYNFSMVIAVGGGYGGSLAVWLNSKYSDDVNAVIASGAPLLAELNYEQYLEHVKDDYIKYAPKRCVQFLQDYYSEITDCSAFDRIDCIKVFKPICSHVNMNVTENRALYYLSVASIFSESAERGIRQINYVCKNLHSDKHYTADTPLFWNDDLRCNDYDVNRFVSKINEQEGFILTKHWMYQCCNEFGFFHTTTGIVDDIELISLDVYLKTCHDIFGPEFTEENIREKIATTNRYYGGLRPTVHNVIFSHGDMDPWQHLGVTEKFNDEMEVIIIPRVSHCKDLQPRNRSDTKALVKARNEIKQYIKDVLDLEEATTTISPHLTTVTFEPTQIIFPTTYSTPFWTLITPDANSVRRG